MLAAGVLPFSATLLMPKWLDLLLPGAAAAGVTCPSGGSSGLIPVITLNLSGGAAMAGNFVPMDQGGQPLANYDLMGLGDGQVPLEREFGTVPFAGLVNGVYISKFLQGLRSKATTALPSAAFVGVCVRSRDDSGENRFAIEGLLNAAGYAGSMLPNIGRNSGSLTGINQSAAVTSPVAPLIVRGLSSINGALGYAGALGSSLNASQKTALAKTVSRLTAAQTRKLASQPARKSIQTLVDCANKKNLDLSGLTNAGVDPRLDATVGAALNGIWEINSGTGDANRDLIFASMTYNALKGNSGAASLELGGYDYHNNTRATGDAADLVAGRTVGQILETAAVMQKPVFLYVTSDGAVTSAQSANRDAPWTSDRGIAGASYMIYYDPAGRKPTSNNQLGWFTAGQAADDKFLTGANPEQAALAVFANYLKLSNKLSLFSKIAGRSFDASNLDKVMRF